VDLIEGTIWHKPEPNGPVPAYLGATIVEMVSKMELQLIVLVMQATQLQVSFGASGNS
jgi:hypothetical protein